MMPPTPKVVLMATRMALRDAASNFSWAKLLKTDITSLWLLKKLLMPLRTTLGKA